MALIKCPDCGREVSEQAPACPNCGRPMASSMVIGTEKAVEFTSKRFKKISLISLGLVILGFIVMIVGMKGEEQRFPITIIAGLLFWAGIITYIVNRVRIWWHHK